jgi:hypothetical protein
MEGTLPSCRTGPHFPWIFGEFISSGFSCKVSAMKAGFQLPNRSRELALAKCRRLHAYLMGDFVIGNIGNNGKGNLRRRFGYPYYCILSVVSDIWAKAHSRLRFGN